MASVAVVLGAWAAACGSEGDVATNAVAVVGTTALTKHQFHEMAARTPVPRLGDVGGEEIVYDPPEFSRCISGRSSPSVPSEPSHGQRVPSETELRRRCELEFEQLKATVLRSMIVSEWRRQEARRLNIKVSTSAVEDEIEHYLDGAKGPQKAAWARDLTRVGNRNVLIAEVREELIEARLIKEAIERIPDVTEADLLRYYEAHRRELRAPERRDVQVVVTSSQTQADAARSALRARASWRSVAERYSVDAATKAQGGMMKVTKGRGGGDAELNKAIFEAVPGQLVGPVAGQFGWYLFRVAQVKSAVSRPFAEARRRIGALLGRRRERDALIAYGKSLVARYENQTKCAAEFEVAWCGNG